MLGLRQSGLPVFRVGDLVRHADWLTVARETAWRVWRERSYAPQIQRWLAHAQRMFPMTAGGIH
jgi:ATP-dependent DNA helicase RecG